MSEKRLIQHIEKELYFTNQSSGILCERIRSNDAALVIYVSNSLKKIPEKKKIAKNPSATEMFVNNWKYIGSGRGEWLVNWFSL